MSGDEESHYAVLGVTEDASPEEIKKAARRLMQTHHPDRGGDPDVAARINTAHAVLSDPAQREEYDRPQDTPASDAPADPDAYEDSWGTEEPWEAPADEEEVLDVEVEEEPPPSTPPRAHHTEPPGTPHRTDHAPAQTPTQPKDPKPTTVRTAQREALLIGLLPTVLMNAAISIESVLVAPAGTSPLIFPCVGIVAAVIALIAFRRKGLPEYPGPRPAAATIIACALAVAALAMVATNQPRAVPAGQAFLATCVGAWVYAKASTRHRLANRIIASKGLREDGTIFGGSTGDTAGEMLNNTIWKTLAHPQMHAARGFQTSDPGNQFTKAVLLGNRVALLRPVFIPKDAIPTHGPAFYWSPPSLFLSSAATGVPSPVMRLELDEYRAAFRSVTTGLTVHEFLVVYTDPTAPAITLPRHNPLMPTVVMGSDAGEAIEQFLAGEGPPVHHVDHQAVAKTLMGLEYRIMHAQ